MSYGKRFEKTKRGKLNIFKVIIVLLLIAIAIFGIYKLSNKKDISTMTAEQQLGREIITENDIAEIKVNTIDDYMNEYNAVLLEKVKEDTYYVSKDGKDYTLYSDGSIIEGKIEIWDGTSKELKIESDTKVLNISSPKELKWIADQIISGERNFSGITISLSKNIDLGGRINGNELSGNKWNSIIGFLESDDNNDEEKIKGFLGTFDGNDNWIKGLIIDNDLKYQGLFGYSKGTIKNLTIKDSYIKGDEGVGAFIGLNAGRIEGCKLENTKVIGNSKVGGFVGINMTESSINRCYNSYNNCEIEGKEYIGGIAGYANNNSSITECQNKSNVRGEEYIGGIVGISFYGTQISACSSLNSTVIGTNYIGGIAGYSQALIENSLNQSDLSGKTYVGGIVGLNYIMGNISSCYNSGNIICEEDYLGGIAGVNNATIVSCYNKGNLTCSNTEDSSVGGICSQNLSESAVNNSYNLGIITAKGYIDGTIGSNYGSVSKCYYLDTTITQNTENSKTDEELKSIDFGEDFKLDSEPFKNGGYPILNWQ